MNENKGFFQTFSKSQKSAILKYNLGRTVKRGPEEEMMCTNV